MLKTRITLGKDSSQKIHISHFQRFPLTPNVLAVNSYIFCLVHQLRVFLVLSVWLLSRYVYFVQNSLFTGVLRIALAFLILAMASICFRISSR